MKKNIAIIGIYLLAVAVLIIMTLAYHKGDGTNITHRVVAIGAWVIFTSLLLAVLLLYRSNQQLKETNKMLYDKAKSQMDYYTKSLQLRKSLEDQIEKLQSHIATTEDNQPAKNAKSKYERSNLDEDTRNQLMLKIITVMDNSEAIYSNDFSLQQLASLVGSNNKYVSQAINETMHINFSALLSQYRIKEACRRLDDTQTYGNQTIEAIAESVGFKSRSNFVTAFKRLTGITPSEFQNQARKSE